MYSPQVAASLYVVQVRSGDSYREHVGSCEFRDFYDAKDRAVQVLRWLEKGHAYDVPDDVLDLPRELRALGIDPAACAVEVVQLSEIAPGRFDTTGVVLCRVIDCADDDEDDRDDDCTDTLSEHDPRAEYVSVQAQVR